LFLKLIPHNKVIRSDSISNLFLLRLPNKIRSIYQNINFPFLRFNSSPFLRFNFLRPVRVIRFKFVKFFTMEVTARINIDSPTGRKLVREIEKHKKVAAVEYPMPEELLNCTALSHNEVWDKVWDKLSNHYGVDVRKLR